MGMLDDKVVLVTGAAAGQGREHVLYSVRQGARAVAVDICDEDSPQFAELRGLAGAAGGEVLCVRGDVTDAGSMSDAVQRAVARFGKVDCVIANAGVYRGSPLWETPAAEWDFVMGVNLDGVWNTIKAVSAHLIERQSGSIVVIASIDGIDPAAGSAAYGVSKAGALSLTRYAAAELGPHGIRVNAIAPGFVDTEMVNSQRFYDYLAGGEGLGTRQHLLDYGRTKVVLKGASVLPPEDIAKVAAFFNSDLAAAVTGTILPVDAGNLLLPHKQK